MNFSKKNFMKFFVIISALVVFILVISKVCYSANADTSAKASQGVKLNSTKLTVNKVIKSPEVISEGDIITSNASTGGAQSNIINVAKKFIGVPYVYGANGPSSFDCSGYTRYVYGMLGISLPRTSQTQYGYGKVVTRGQLQTGDLVFFNTNCNLGHVGIYIGNGDFIHASCSRGVTISSLYEGYYSERFAGGTRVIG